MTKLMEQWVAKVSSLPEETQNALAQRLLSEWDEHESVPRWHLEMIEERLDDEVKQPDDYISLEDMKAKFAQRRQLL